jgi:hypothetical protein
MGKRLDLHKIDSARNHHEPLIERKKIEEQQRRAYVKKQLKSPPHKYEGKQAHIRMNTQK